MSAERDHLDDKLVDWIARIYRFPAAPLAFVCIGFILLCYFVLPPEIGVVLILLAAPLPWYEDRLKRRSASRIRGVTNPRN